MAAERSRTNLAAGAVLALSLAAPSSALAWCQMTSSTARPTEAEPCVLAANHPGTYPLAWRRPCTAISLSSEAASSDLTSDEVRNVFQDAIAAWTTADCGGATTGLQVQVIADTNLCTEAVHYSNGRNVNSIMFVAEGWSSERGHDPRAFALTYVWHDPESGMIFDADMEINEERGEYTVCPDTGCDDGRIDLPNVVTHEMGHYFGLAHTPDDATATMWASAPTGETQKRSLETDDVTGICSVYPPGALPSACDYAPRGGYGLDCAPPSSCGCSAPGAGTRGTWTAALGALVGLSLVARRRRRD